MNQLCKRVNVLCHAVDSDYPYICSSELKWVKRFKQIFIVVILILLALLAAGLFLPGFLSLNRPVKTNNVLLEAWISHHEIEQAVARFGGDQGARFFVAGRSFPSAETGISGPSPHAGEKNADARGTWLYANSSLGFSVPEELTGTLPDTVLITVEANGQMAAGHFAYFNAIVNSSVLGGRFSGEDYSKYTFLWVSRGQPLKSLFIRFINDLKGPDSDRNLNVKSVTVNGIRIPADALNAKITREQNLSTTGYASQAEETAAYLVALGVPPAKVEVVAFRPPERNLTRAAAVQFSKFVTNHNINAFNVVSSGIHCRRTWITYRKLAGRNADVGIVNFVPEGYIVDNPYADRPFVFLLAEEYFAYLVNWLQLSFS